MQFMRCFKCFLCENNIKMICAITNRENLHKTFKEAPITMGIVKHFAIMTKYRILFLVEDVKFVYLNEHKSIYFSTVYSFSFYAIEQHK